MLATAGCSEEFSVGSGDDSSVDDTAADVPDTRVDTSSDTGSGTEDTKTDATPEVDSTLVDVGVDSAETADALLDVAADVTDSTIAPDSATADTTTVDTTTADTMEAATDTYVDPCLGKVDGAACGGGSICKGGACVAPVCGDSLITPSAGEECEDGNSALCDGCEACARRKVLVVPAAASARSDGLAASLSSTGGACYEAWARIDAGAPADAIYLSSTSGGSNSHFIVRCSTAAKVLSFAVENGSPPIEAKYSVNCGDGVFHHVAACRQVTGSTADLRLFWDGTLVASATGAATKIGTPTSVVIGGVTYGAEGLGGRIDEVRISKIQRYTANFVPSRRHSVDADTVALFHLDEGTGTVAKDVVAAQTLTLVGTSWADDTGYRAADCSDCVGKADGTSCGASTSKVCSAGLCVTAACSTGDHRCSSDKLEKCSSTRLGFDLVSTCAPGLCDVVGRECDECLTGAKGCVGDTPRTCDATGHWVSAATCSGTTPTCVAGLCAPLCRSVTAPANAFVKVPSLASALSATGDACYEVWAKLTNPGADANYILSSVAGPSTSHFNLLCFGSAAAGGARLSFSVDNGAAGFIAAEKAMTCADGVFHHIAACRSIAGSTATLSLFVDGTQVATASGAATRIAAPTTVMIGGYAYEVDASQPGLTGTIDEVRISNTLRYTAAFTPAKRFTVDASTVALFHLDEGTGTTAVDSTATAHVATLSSKTSWSSTCP
ncbi:MAG: hypothetical protein IPJ34_43210 [Myxococcales bacterium]|nr:hypothetical protein [Myxococcales bacterium]